MMSILERKLRSLEANKWYSVWEQRSFRHMSSRNYALPKDIYVDREVSKQQEPPTTRKPAA